MFPPGPPRSAYAPTRSTFALVGAHGVPRDLGPGAVVVAVEEERVLGARVLGGRDPPRREVHALPREDRERLGLGERAADPVVGAPVVFADRELRAGVVGRDPRLHPRDQVHRLADVRADPRFVEVRRVVEALERPQPERRRRGRLVVRERDARCLRVVVDVEGVEEALAVRRLPRLRLVEVPRQEVLAAVRGAVGSRDRSRPRRNRSTRTSPRRRGRGSSRRRPAP